MKCNLEIKAKGYIPSKERKEKLEKTLLPNGETP